MTDLDDNPAKRLVILGLLLQTLHVLFGFTAVMGMFINHMLIDQSKDTLYHSHIRWQLVTFWVTAALYAVAFFAWLKLGLLWPAAFAMTFAFYRITIGAYYYLIDQPIQRII